MKPDAWQAYLVRLGMEAFDRVKQGTTEHVTSGAFRTMYEHHLRERMAQAAKVIVTELGSHDAHDKDGA